MVEFLNSLTDNELALLGSAAVVLLSGGLMILSGRGGRAARAGAEAKSLPVLDDGAQLRRDAGNRSRAA